MSSQIKALEAFADSPDLLRLEGMLNRFNLFEALGVVRQELRHSDFLACLLNPYQNHGLKGVFLREFLRAVQQTAAEGSTLALLNLDALKLNGCRVEREWYYVDILIIDDENRLAVIIENKIGTGEHSDQLNRYCIAVNGTYPTYTIVPLYLTPNGAIPSDNRYQAISYTQVYQVIKQILENEQATLGTDVRILLEHYAQMLRRHIMNDSEEADLCLSIYREHKQALDLIFEHRPDQQVLVNDYASHLINHEPTVTAYYSGKISGKSFVQFNPVAWGDPRLYKNVYPNCPWFLYFQFLSEPGSLKIELLMTPGNSTDREKVFQVAQSGRFQGCPPELIGMRNRGGWSLLFEKTVLRAIDYDLPQEDIEVIMSRKWSEFVDNDLPFITRAIRDEKWLWELP